MTMDSDAPEISKTPPANAATYFDGTSSRRRAVTLHFADRLEISEDEQTLAAWDYADIRRADSPSGMLRLGCLTRACAGAAGGSRQRAGRRTGLTLRQAG